MSDRAWLSMFMHARFRSRDRTVILQTTSACTSATCPIEARRSGLAFVIRNGRKVLHRQTFTLSVVHWVLTNSINSVFLYIISRISSHLFNYCWKFIKKLR